MNDHFLDKKLEDRIHANALRKLVIKENKIDFCSNDYLGIVKNKSIERIITTELSHGSTGSRLLSGNYKLVEETERQIADFHNAEAGLIFNSGYDANTGLLSSVPQKKDVIIYDQLSHASLRDGIRLSFATSFSFLHNDLNDLEKKLSSAGTKGQVYVVTESVFSMDGDYAPLHEIADLCEKYQAAFIVDEAHATGVVGRRGEGLLQKIELEKRCFARIHTFGKACGTHGAVVLGSEKLRQYLINFSRQFIYSTSLPPVAVGAIAASYQLFPEMEKERNHLQKLIGVFKNAHLKYKVLSGDTPIQIVIIPGNDEVKQMGEILQQNNFDIRAILYPTVPKGQERLRLVLHAFNSVEEVGDVIKILAGS
ncbi:MAG: pyridoxal phosphate-dependent aminotransferase family protein [Ginsengibacter sp.]